MDITLFPQLLAARLDANASAPHFAATTRAHGLYSTEQFVLRLSPEVFRKLSMLEAGIVDSSLKDFQGMQAMSTYLHETIHWWQHIGSTYGFIFSLNYPIQAHCTHSDLNTIAADAGFKKSIFLQALELNKNRQSDAIKSARTANTIINNHFDLRAFRELTFGPRSAANVAKHELFLGVGHAFKMTYSHTVAHLASTVDPSFQAIPHPKDWIDGFRELEKIKADGFHPNSPAKIPPIGSLDIFEGQARFCQIQYLYYASGKRLSWQSFRDTGMLCGEYVRAFKLFLQLTESQWPTDVDDPLVGLFLLVCDLAINPGRGFPFSVAPNFEMFINKVNPGYRFCVFSTLISIKFPSAKKAIRKHDREEYSEITTALCIAAREFPALQVAGKFAEWFAPNGQFKELRIEYESYKFEPGNFVLRHLFAHFLAFQEDKCRCPEFFCWPGAWLSGDNLSQRERLLFEKHGTLFIDKENDNSVFARIQSQRDALVVQNTFEQFYHNVVTFGLINQWISQPGPFRYDIGWLKESASSEEMEVYLRGQFRATFGLDPTDVQVLEH
ncbi:hypothetical protein [Burkholderia glumae]|uniref:hypothetical protein n=1 Tax=Burkholderia glumae TaxID=337 RepID=UPI0021645971|nr:hypothetical protein [Burkholderia glumae]